MRNRSIIVSVFIIVAAMAVVTSGCKKATGPAVPPIPEVVVTDVVQRDVPVYSDFVGTTVGFVNAQIYPKISGYLLKQDYRDGSHVHANQLLFEIDDRPYKAALDQALGTLAEAQAQLKQNQQNLDRYTILYQQAVISKQDFQNQTQTTRATAAQVQAYQAAVETAKLNLGWTKVYSPIDGVVAIAQAQVGDLLSTTTLLTTVSQLDPIKVTFPIPEKEYMHFAAQINAVENGVKLPALPFQMILDNGKTYPHPGNFYAANRQVDVQTGTIQIQATFPNPDNILRPGQYAKIRVAAGVVHNALLVPQDAVLETQGQYQVAVVGSDNKVTMRTVEVGQQAGGLQIIEKGVSPGERVITEGLQKVSDGMEVKPQSVRPEPALAESPASTDQAPSNAATPGSQS
ncbi:MAG: efflux RND transporter periplasmic adaptor subunit [Candidatus Binatus sp.]|uniref:efflux RND transporter periplasmic adaptor subunit n=1 Tax=Candidatus Binatus sp. TaxID=2811406 RepID=UPI003BB14773